MSGKSGFSNQKKIGPSQFETVHNVGSDKMAANIIQKLVAERTLAAQAIVSVTPSNDLKELTIEITGHNAKIGDVLRFYSGVCDELEADIVRIVDPDNFVIYNVLGAIPAAADTAKVHFFVSMKGDDDGALSIASGPLQYVLDGVNTTVEEDTVTPANNRPLPTKLFDVSGDPINPATEDKQDDIITELQQIEADVEAGNVLLTTISNIDFATEAKQDTQIANIGPLNAAKETDPDAASASTNSLLRGILENTGAAGGGDATAANQVTEIGHLAAIETAVEAIQVLDFATEAKQDTQITELQQIEADVEAAVTQLTALNAIDYATEAKQDSIITELQDIEADVTTVGANIGAPTSAKETDPDAASANLNSLVRGMLEGINSLVTSLAANHVPTLVDVKTGSTTVPVGKYARAKDKFGDLKVNSEFTGYREVFTDTGTKAATAFTTIINAVGLRLDVEFTVTNVGNIGRIYAQDGTTQILARTGSGTGTTTQYAYILGDYGQGTSGSYQRQITQASGVCNLTATFYIPSNEWIKVPAGTVLDGYEYIYEEYDA